jgi:hypothetical protein
MTMPLHVHEDRAPEGRDGPTGWSRGCQRESWSYGRQRFGGSNGLDRSKLPRLGGRVALCCVSRVHQLSSLHFGFKNDDLRLAILNGENEKGGRNLTAKYAKREMGVRCRFSCVRSVR